MAKYGQLLPLGAAAKSSVSGRSRQHAEVAVAVDAGRRDESGEAIEQLERRQDLRATASGPEFGWS